MKHEALKYSPDSNKLFLLELHASEAGEGYDALSKGDLIPFPNGKVASDKVTPIHRILGKSRANKTKQGKKIARFEKQGIVMLCFSVALLSLIIFTLLAGLLALKVPSLTTALPALFILIPTLIFAVFFHSVNAITVEDHKLKLKFWRIFKLERS